MKKTIYSHFEDENGNSYNLNDSNVSTMFCNGIMVHYLIRDCACDLDLILVEKTVNIDNDSFQNGEGQLDYFGGNKQIDVYNPVGNRNAVVLKKENEWVQLIVMNSCWPGIVHVINEVIEDRPIRLEVSQMTINEVIETYNLKVGAKRALRGLQDKSKIITIKQ